MATDEQRLIVSLEARIDKFQKSLDQATGVASTRTRQIEKRFADANTNIVRGMSGIGKTALGASNANARLIAGMSSVSAGMAKTAEGAVEVSHAIGGMTTQGMAAFHTLRGGTEMLLQGVSPMRVLAMEMNNITYAASGSGGLKGAFMEALSIFKGMLNPVAALTAGIVGAGLAIVGMGSSFAREQSKINLALTGVGKSAGMTVGQINQIGEAVSKTGDLSTSEATDIATAIASTGRASAESTEKATALARAYSLVFNKDLDKSAIDLANAIADPGRAIDGLNDRLGAWSAKQVELVKNLTISGDRQKAAKIIIDGLQKSIGDATVKTDFWTRSWDGLKNAISNAITASGKAIDDAAGIRTPEDALAAAQARLTVLQQGRTGPRGGTVFGSPDEIQRQIDLVARLTAQVDALHKASNDNRDSVEVSDIVTGIDPTIKKLNELQTTIDKIKSVPIGNLDEASQGVVKNVLDSLQSQHDLLAKDIALSQQKYGVTLAQAEADKRAAKLEIDAINARTPAQKADIAYLQTRNALLDQGKSPQEAEIGAQIARTKTLTEIQRQLSEAQRDRIFQSQQDIEQGAVENQTIGRSVEVATRLTRQFQLLAAAKAEAFKNGTQVSAAEQLNALIKADEAGRQAAKDANDRLAFDQNFDRSQIGRDRDEQQVYARLQSAGLLDNGEIVSAQAKMRAEQERFNITLAETLDIEKGFASSFLHDLLSGKSAAESLGNALNEVASKLLDMGIDKLISGSLGGGTATGLASLFSGFADGGVFVPGKGPQKLKTFAGGGISNQAAIFGEAGPEAAIPLKGGKVPVDLRMPKVSASAPAAAPNITISIDARNSTKESVDALNANTLPKIQDIVRKEVLQTLGRSSTAKQLIRRA